jgi:hypothetical protein
MDKITGQESTDNILNMIDDSNPSSSNSQNISIDASQIGSGVSTATVNAVAGNQQAGKSLFTSTTPGYILGVNGAGVAQFAIGDVNSYMQWDGTNLTVVGNITGSSITGGTFQTNSSAPFIRITSASASNPSQLGNSIAVVDASNNVLINFGSTTAVLMQVQPVSDKTGLFIQSGSTIVTTLPLAIFNVLDTSSSSVVVGITNAGTGQSLSINDQSTSGTNSAVVISYARAGSALQVTVSHAGGNPTAIYINTANSSGNSYAFDFEGSEVVSAAVGGSQNRKIRILLPSGAVYFIPCYDA